MKMKKILIGLCLAMGLFASIDDEVKEKRYEDKIKELEKKLNE